MMINNIYVLTKVLKSQQICFEFEHEYYTKFQNLIQATVPL